MQSYSEILQKTKKIIFWNSILFLLFVVLTFTVGQYINIEFKSSLVSFDFYSSLFFWTPIAIILTLFGLKKTYSPARKIATSIVTIILSAIVWEILFLISFAEGFHIWRTTTIIYENNENPNKQIREMELRDYSYNPSKKRIVQTEIFLGKFLKISNVDTNKIDKNSWKRTDKAISYYEE